jgi:5-methyltetrahydrofolate--homocysteine methyltransferase
MKELALHFPEEGWERIRRDWSAWWAGELDRPMVVLECLPRSEMYAPHCAIVFLANHALTDPVAPILAEFESRLESTHWLGDSFPRFWVNFGPGVAAAFAGAQVHPSWDTTWFSPGQTGPLSAFHVETDWSNPWWQRVDEFTRAALERWGSQLAVGLTDLGGNLDILASLRDTHPLLFDLHDAPDEIDRLVRETTRLWLDCFNHLCSLIEPAGRGVTCWGPLWAPARGYMLQSDFAYMISPKMFERFVLPDLEACTAAMQHAFYHLDGKGQLVHVEALLSLPRLRGIQWVPGAGAPPCEQWLPLLKRIRDAGKLCQVTVNPEGALTILRELGGKGFCFNINEPQLTPEEGQAFLELLSAR